MPRLDLESVVIGLAKDLQALRAGKITNADARVRAQLGREILRGAHLHLEGIKTLQAQEVNLLEAKPENSEDKKP